ncbi:MAG: arylsulfatase [Planctomycetota bacterium]|nr:arylsulfatase [Planctomycetota bacterium]
MGFTKLTSCNLFFVLVGFSQVLYASNASKPNVLIVLIDDAGYGDFGCTGHPFLKTPNIDKLHDESVRLTDFHVAPMCTPTRGQLLTGQDALRNAAASVTAGRAVLRPGIPTLPELLAKEGWATGIFGKWHLGDSYPHRPMDKGFKTSVWMKGWGFTSAPEFSNTLFDGHCLRGSQQTRFPGYITDFCFDEAMKWMGEQSRNEAPFFCYLPLHAAHSPYVVPDKFSAPFAGEKAPKFFGMLSNIDENMGRLNDFLVTSNLHENTIVVFMTDNGGTAGVPVFNAGLRGHKTEYYDGGHRVPCLIKWPAGNLRPRGVSIPTHVQDLMPTLLEICGNSKELLIAKEKMDGVSLLKLLRDDSPIEDRMLVVQYGASPPHPDDPKKWRSCVVWDQWRLVHGEELYETKSDRSQQVNVAGKYPEIVSKMRTHYEEWWAGIEPHLGDFVPMTIGADQENPVGLTSSDWQDVYADNSGHIRNGAGGPRGGPWNVDVEREGEYEIRLRRWPFDLNTPLDGNVTPLGKVLPIAAASLKIGSIEKQVKTALGSQEAVFVLNLPAGRTQLQAWFQDAKGDDLCGAYFASVYRKP